MTESSGFVRATATKLGSSLDLLDIRAVFLENLMVLSCSTAVNFEKHKSTMTNAKSLNGNTQQAKPTVFDIDAVLESLILVSRIVKWVDSSAS
jgi:hypothetical protein